VFVPSKKKFGLVLYFWPEPISATLLGQAPTISNIRQAWKNLGTNTPAYFAALATKKLKSNIFLH
jgi:hypothetical protein